ncbi:hypothetical protein M422DRAFT_70086 [Sphaerobolus stellatus SS14]|uniref:Uncharacterized protein n=1 Tax=Sphaerobolus stellatus (strain SS14) TaxID=990650 RepID=A0A0C9VBG3_SPHS4|nr:hypothetical protein M422DRAFT_70086 [Sphaerobolus stellatus SS14]
MSKRVISSSICLFNMLSNEVLDQILQETIADSIHKLCVPPAQSQRPPNVWNALKVLPQVCHRFRDLSFRLLSIAFCMQFTGFGNREPLNNMTQIMHYLSAVSPCQNESYHQSAKAEPARHGVSVAGYTLDDLKGILKIYWDVAVMHVEAQDVLKIHWRRNQRWAAAIGDFMKFISNANEDANWFYSQMKPLDLTCRALDYIKEYDRMYHSVCMYWLIRQGLQVELDDFRKRRPAVIKTLMESFISNEDNLLVTKQRLPKFVKRAMQTTDFMETLERVESGPIFGPAKQLARDVLIRWRDFVGKSDPPKDKDNCCTDFLS